MASEYSYSVLGLKVLLANPLGKLWSQAQSIGFESLSTPLAWMSVIAFSLQLYFDFFGYSLMAEGLGEMLGFTLPKKLQAPICECHDDRILAQMAYNARKLV